MTDDEQTNQGSAHCDCPPGCCKGSEELTMDRAVGAGEIKSSGILSNRQQLREVILRCTHSDCRAVDRVKLYENEGLPPIVNCWACHRGQGQPIENMLKTNQGMKPIGEVPPSLHMTLEEAAEWIAVGGAMDKPETWKAALETVRRRAGMGIAQAPSQSIS